MSKLVTIKISPETRAKLHKLKAPGETYDTAIRELLFEHSQKARPEYAEEAEG